MLNFLPAVHFHYRAQYKVKVENGSYVKVNECNV